MHRTRRLVAEAKSKLSAGQQPQVAGSEAFLQRIEALKQRSGGGIDDFEPTLLDFVPVDPFV